SGILGSLGFLSKRHMREKGEKELASLGVRLKDINAPDADLYGGQKQSVAVARAATWGKKIIFIDETPPAMGFVQTKHVIELIKRVRDAGIAVVLISHNMPEVLDISDRVQVLRLGRRVATFSAQDASVEDLVRAMTSGTAEVQQ